jgi:fermentation-respiration switch protein FrsA (DUF1100 family)
MNVSFAVPFEGFLLRGDAYETPCRAVVLHGAGKSSRRRFSRLRQALHARGVPTAAFDFIGHGETGGDLIGSSLQSRTEQAAAVIQKVGQEPLALLGASMGRLYGHQTDPSDSGSSISFCWFPPSTRRGPMPSPLGRIFLPRSASPRVGGTPMPGELLARFRGNLLVFAAEEDAVIPFDVVKRIYGSARQSRMRHLHVVPGSHPHRALPHRPGRCPGGGENCGPDQWNSRPGESPLMGGDGNLSFDSGPKGFSSGFRSAMIQPSAMGRWKGEEWEEAFQRV